MVITQEQIVLLSEMELDELPVGIIRLDRTGRILYYNRAQAALARRTASSTVGLNFFTEVAPCTVVKDFQGRFLTFVDHPGARIEPFTFLFRFSWGEKLVSITMVRRAGDPPSIMLVVTPVTTKD